MVWAKIFTPGSFVVIRSNPILSGEEYYVRNVKKDKY